MMNGRQASSAGYDSVAAGMGKQPPPPSQPISNGSQEPAPGSGRTPLREVGSTMVISIYLPELEVRRRHEIDIDENLWAAKIRLLATLDNGGLRDGLNCSFYLPPANGRAGKFLDDERPLKDYPLTTGDLMLEFKQKRRVYRQPTVSLGKLRRLHTRENLKQLMSVVKARALDKVAKLLAKGLDPNFQDAESGETPLTTAAILSDCHSMVTTLVGGGNAHLDFRNRQSLTPMHVAAACGNAAAITVLLELGASPNSKDRKGLTPLFYVCASRQGSVPCAELLLRDYAAIGCQDQLGYTELHQACKNGHLQLAEMLVFYGADMNARNADGWTPLHSCVAANQIPCLKMLLQRGASKQVVDLSSQTPLQTARLLNKAEAAAALEAHDSSLVRPFNEVPQYSQRRRLTGTNLEVLRRLAESDARLSASSASLLNHDSLATAAMLNATTPRSSSMTRSYHSSSVHGGGDGDFDDDLGDAGLEHWAAGPRASLGHLSLYLPRERRSLTNELNEVLGARTEDGHWSRSLRSSTSGSSSYRETASAAAVGATGSALSPERHAVSVSAAAMGAAAPPQQQQPASPLGTAPDQHWLLDGSSAAAQPAAGDPGADDSSRRMKAVVLSKGKKGYGFVLRGAKAAQLKKMDVAFEPTDRMPALQYLDAVEAGSVADKAGLKAGDFIAEINGVDVTCTNHEDLVQLIKACGATLSMKVISPVVAPDHLDRTLASFDSQAAPSAAQQPASLGGPSGQWPKAAASFGKASATAATTANYATLPLAAAKQAAAAAPLTATGGPGTAADSSSTAPLGSLTLTQRQLQATAATLSASASTKVASIRARPSSQLFVTSAEMENIIASGGLPLPAATMAAAEGQPRDGRMPPPPPPPRGGLTVGAAPSIRADRTEPPSVAAAAATRLSGASSGGTADQQRLPLGVAASTGAAGSRRPSASGSSVASWQSGSDTGDVGLSAAAVYREQAGASGSARPHTSASATVASRSPEALRGSAAAAAATAQAVPPEYSVVFIPPAPGHPPPAVPLPSSHGATVAAGSRASPDAEQPMPAKGFLPRTPLPQRDGAAAPERGGGGGSVMSSQLPPPPPPPPPPLPPLPLLLPPGDAAGLSVGRSGVAKAATDFKLNKGGALEDGGGGGVTGRDNPPISSRSSSVGSATSLTGFGDSLRNAVTAVAERRNGSMAGDESLAARSRAGREELDRSAAQMGASSLDTDLQKALQKRQAALELLSQSAPVGAPASDAAAAPPAAAGNSLRAGAAAAASDTKGSQQSAAVEAVGSARRGSAGAIAAGAGTAEPAAVAEGAPFTEMAERVRMQWLAARKADLQPPLADASLPYTPAAAAQADKPAKKPPPPVPVKKVAVRMEHHSPTKRASGAAPCFPMPASGAAAAAAAAATAEPSAPEPAAGAGMLPPPLEPSTAAGLLGTAATGPCRPGGGRLNDELAAGADDLELPPPPPPPAFDGACDGEQQDSEAALPLPPPSSFSAGLAADERLPPQPGPPAAADPQPGAAVALRATAGAADDRDGSARVHGQPAAGVQGPDRDLSYVEKRVDAWSVADVGNWLEGHGLGEYRAAFADNCVDGESLVNLTRDDVKELGLDKVGHRVKFEKEVKKLAYFLANSSSDA